MSSLVVKGGFAALLAKNSCLQRRRVLAKLEYIDV